MASCPRSGTADRARQDATQLGLATNDIVVSYIGTVGMAHGLATVLDAAAVADDSHPGFRSIVVGDGAELQDLRRARAERRTDECDLHGLASRSEIPSILAATDIALVTLKPSDVFKTVLPSKMFEAMAARKPIVLAVDGEAKQILECASGGVCVQPGNAHALANALVALAASAHVREQLGTSGANYVAREFNRSAWAHHFLQILCDVSATDSPVSGAFLDEGASGLADILER